MLVYIPIVKVVQSLLAGELEGHAVGEAGLLLDQGGHSPRPARHAAVRLVALPELARVTLNVPWINILSS